MRIQDIDLRYIYLIRQEKKKENNFSITLPSSFLRFRPCLGSISRRRPQGLSLLFVCKGGGTKLWWRADAQPFPQQTCHLGLWHGVGGRGHDICDLGPSSNNPGQDVIVSNLAAVVVIGRRRQGRGRRRRRNEAINNNFWSKNVAWVADINLTRGVEQVEKSCRKIFSV